MDTGTKQANSQSSESHSGFLLGLARAFWTLFGPVLLAASILYEVKSRNGWVSRSDAFIAAIVILMIACRWMEQRLPGAKTAYGDPSTPAHFRRYILILILAVGITWAVANVVANHVLS